MITIVLIYNRVHWLFTLSVQIYKLKFYIHYEYNWSSETLQANSDWKLLIRRYKLKTHQKLCEKTPDSDKSSVSRFVRRTFSATMIGIHHLLTIQIGESTLSSATMTLVLLYELITWYGRIFSYKNGIVQRLLDLVKIPCEGSVRSPAGFSLTATDSIHTLHPPL